MPERRTTIAPAMRPRGIAPQIPSPPSQTAANPYQWSWMVESWFQLVMSWYARAPMIPKITPHSDIWKTRSQSPPQRTQRTPVSQMQPAMPISSITPYMWIVKCDAIWNEPDDGDGM